jgi:hypothetical protein
MKLRHPILSILSIIVLVGASIAGPATSASAGTDRWTSTTDSTPTGGVAIFDADSADGEILYVCDLDRDGHVAYGRFTWIGGSISFVDSGEEDGRCTVTAAFEVPEGSPVAVTACLSNKLSGTLDYCRTLGATA